MHRVTASLAEGLHYGFDAGTLYLRVDFAADAPPGADVGVDVEVLAPAPMTLHAGSLAAGRRPLERETAGGREAAGEAAVEDVLELAIPFAALGASSGDVIELLLHFGRGGERLESLPAGQPLRVTVPGPEWEARHWSA
jgi:hypothetical protein